MNYRSFARIILLLSLSPLSLAQSIDLGRDELPVHIPESYTGSEPVPLILLLHGYSYTGVRQDNLFKISPLADDFGFLLVAPNGTREPEGRGAQFWNATEACCNFYHVDVDDSAYILSIIEEMKENYNVDEKRVYLIGWSNGGFMSYRMAYEHSDTIAAIASVAGANHLERRDPPPNGVHVLQIHGTNDRTIEYQGGSTATRRQEGQGGYYPGALSTIRRWASYNDCQPEGQSRERRDLDASLPGHETGVLKFEIGCRPNGSAELWTIASGNHSPVASESFGAQIVEWLYAHPKR